MKPADTAETRSVRLLRVGEQVRHALSDILMRGDVHDDVLAKTHVTVTEVRMSPDLRHATAFVKPLLGKDEEVVLKALRTMGSDPSINTVLLDGMTVLSGHIISHITGGGTEKQMGFDGWGQMLGGLRAVSFACEQLKKQGKNLVMTAWEAPPEYEDTMAGQQLKASGRPYLLGKAKFWLPGGCDIVARMTSKMVNAKGADGKFTKTWKGELHFDRDGIWLAKSRWPLPSPFPADFAKLLASVKGAAASMSSATPVAKTGPKPVPPTSSKPKG